MEPHEEFHTKSAKNFRNAIHMHIRSRFTALLLNMEGRVDIAFSAVAPRLYLDKSGESVMNTAEMVSVWYIPN